nr:DUF4190 domain-containing protein [Kibdelosporangium sp. MJ126-NF4]CEL18947.1 hypothetical protein [Kibdelosporangium sp. MJ126-NF4]CTQ95250.1 hypothetical protein [Kibdelosporangium sp. MJ126-NF4]
MSYAYNDRRNGYGNAAMVLGLLAGVLSLIPVMFYVALPVAALSVACGLIGRSRVKRGSASNNGAAITGVAIGVLAVALTFWTSARTTEKNSAAQQARRDLEQAGKELAQAGRELDKSLEELGRAGEGLSSVLNTPSSLPAPPITSQTTSSSTPPPPAAPSGGKKKIAEFSGNGSKQTEKFAVGSSWEVAWSYDCAGIDVGTVSYDTFEMIARTVGKEYEYAGRRATHTGQKGSDVQSFHKTGEFFLDVNTRCKWTVVVSG